MKTLKLRVLNPRMHNVIYMFDGKALKPKGDKYDCPPVSFDIWAFILNATTFQTRATSVSEIQEWLAEVGGVHLYENGLRVNPYGNPGNDWLDMNLARTRSPEERYFNSQGQYIKP